MDGQQPPSGFSPHVLNQLSQVSQQVSQPQRGHGRGRGRGRGRGVDQARQYHQPSALPNPYSGPPSMDSYPPLGSPPAQTPANFPAATPLTQQSQPTIQPYQPNNQPRDFSGRTRGAFRGQQSQPYQDRSRHHPHQYQAQSNDDYRRPPTQNRTLYQQNSGPSANIWPASSAQQRTLRQQTMAQADHLNRVQQECRNKYQLKQAEQVVKETFRKRLENYFQDTLSKQYPDLEPHGVRLKCYGSLNNGFGLAGCDMDLLLALPDNFASKILAKPAQTAPKAELMADAKKPVDQTEDAATDTATEEAKQEGFEVGWLLEGALLDVGIGARLLTKTRVPILKVCESPSKELLETLRQYRLDQLQVKTPQSTHSDSEPIFPPPLDLKALDDALGNLDDQDTAAKVSLPASPPQRPGASLEFDGDFGIKCDVNFGNSLAVHNTRLLREYCLFDPRVAQVGVFVKAWARSRDINTPYYGTLSSYGYVLMVLHFLMNVVKPPVIPNLQYLAHNEDAWRGKPSIELFEGKYDIRFLADKRKIDDYRQTMTPNRDSTGNLIRGFFWYYTARDGFNWKNDIVSLRTPGGILKKFTKGWTEAKWSENTSKKNVRLRFLMAIEDPFETEHNVARVVGHNGIVAIRDEFRRSWEIISRIGTEDPMPEGLMEPMKGRGDTLRKDQDHHREKMKKLKEAFEAKERTLRQIAANENAPSQENGTSSDSEFPSFPLRPVSGNRRSSNPKLTSHVGTFQSKPRHSSRRVRKVKDESDSEVDNEAKPVSVERTYDKEIEEDIEPFCPVEDIYRSYGWDPLGNPVGWDMDTQDGRWLRWRDNKIRDGTWTGVTQPHFVILDKACPYDERRFRSHRFHTSLLPPFPFNKTEDEGKPSDVPAHRHRASRRKPPIASKSSEKDSVTFENGAAADTSAATVPSPRSSPVLGPTATDASRTASPAVDPSPTDLPEDTSITICSADNEVTASVANALPTAFLTDVAPTATATASSRTCGNRNGRALQPLKWYKSAAGWFLTRRDWLIRSGAFRFAVLDDWEQKLHSNFPYDPDMLSSTLQVYNKELARQWLVRPLTTSDQLSEQRTTKSDINPTPMPQNISTVITELKGLLSKLDRPPSLSRDISVTHARASEEISSPAKPGDVVSEFTENTDQTEQDMANSAFIRCRRLAYFAQKLAAESTERDVVSETDERTVRTLMREVGIDINRPQLTKKDSAIGIWASSDSELGTEVEPTEQMSPSPRLETVSPEPGYNEDNSGEEQIEAKERVPSSLYRYTPNDERPRDENPQIMPIPRIQDFPFDVRQLQDLAVIQEGGNGCARAGEEFNIEEDYELGGGGEMGYKSSSGARQSSATDRAMYEYGRGDEDGLLNELPGIEE